MTVVQFNGINREDLMRVRNKEHQSLGMKELKQLAFDFPNDARLGEEIRRIVKEDSTYVRPENAHPTPTKGG